MATTLLSFFFFTALVAFITWRKSRGEDLPADWRCPPCKQPKAKFNPA